jgi:putative Mg2+ transporter-C (MgtC) family protein
MLSHQELLVRITVAALLGGVIGYERDRHGKPVGLRTHFIVAMASATFMVISTQFVFWQHYHEGQLVEVDTSRIAAAIVSGIGFLAGGAILRTGVTVQGLTTAAGLWLVTAIGMCSGAGMFVEAAFVTALGIAALTLLRLLEDKNMMRLRVSVIAETASAIVDASKAMTSLGASVAAVRHDSRRVDDNTIEALFDVQILRTVPIPDIVSAIETASATQRVCVDVQA